MITGSAACNPEELGPGFLNIHKTLMCLYSALHQGMSAIYIMLPLRSVTACRSLSCPRSVFRHDVFPQRASEHCLFPFCLALFDECFHFPPMSRKRRKREWEREREGHGEESERERGKQELDVVGFSKGLWMGKVAFPSPVQRRDIRR